MKKLAASILLLSVSWALAGISIPGGGGSGSSLPPLTGQAGKFLNTDGSITQWLAVPGGGDMLAANNLSDLASAATARTNLSLVPGTNVQAYDADLLLYGAIPPSSNIQTFLGAANYAAMRTLLGLVPGTDVQIHSANLTSLASASGTNTIYARTGIDTWTPVNIGANLSFSGGTLSATGGGGGGSGDMLAANNLSDVASVATARTNLQLNTPTGWASSDKLATVGAPSGGIAPLRLDAGSGSYVDTQPVGSASDISLTFAPKGTASVIQLTNSGFTTGFGITGSTFPGGGGVAAGEGITFFTGGSYYKATAAGLALLSGADAAAQRVSLALNDIANFTSSLGLSGTASSSTFLRGDGSWSSVTASAPGSNTEVVFNDGGILGSDSGLTYNKTTDTINIANMTVTQLNAVNFKVFDTNQSHGMSWVVNGDWTADKTFTYTGEFSFALTLGADSTLAMSGDAITFADNVRQTFNPGATTPGFNFGSYPGDPSGVSNGDAWYDSTGNLLRARINGATVSLGAGGGSVSDGDKGEVVVSGSGATWMLDDNIAVSGAVLTSPRIVTNLLDTNGNELFVLTATASAVNEITYSNAATAGNPKFLASGGDSAVGIDFETKGAAGVRFLGNSTQSARFRMHEDTDNGTNQISLVAPAAITSDVDVELPATSGTLQVSRTGVRRTVYINAGAMIARTTNGAAAAVPTELATNDIMFDSFDFDSTTSEGVGFWWTPPTTYNAGTVTVKFNWTAASGSGTATWSISARAFGDDDAMDQALGTAQATTDTLITANDMHVTSTTSALTIAGTPAANKPTYWQITRDVADTLSSDAKLLGCTIEYTESSTEPSAQ